jgi:hypothetical protein
MSRIKTIGIIILMPGGTPAELSSANIQDMPKWWEEQP